MTATTVLPSAQAAAAAAMVHRETVRLGITHLDTIVTAALTAFIDDDCSDVEAGQIARAILTAHQQATR